MTPSPYVLAAIIAAHRAVACEVMAYHEPTDARVWRTVADAEHRKKRLALAQLNVDLRRSGEVAP